METVFDKEKKKELLVHLRDKTEDKVVGLFEVAGMIHEGHLHIIKQARKKCDILLIDYHQMWYPSVATIAKKRRGGSVKTSPQGVIEILKKEENQNIADFVIFTEFDEYTKKQIDFLESFKPQFQEVCSNLGIDILLDACIAFSVSGESIHYVDKVFQGPKNQILERVTTKVLGQKNLYRPETIFSFYREKDSTSLGRYSSSRTLGRMAKEAKECILKGKLEKEIFEDISKSWYVESPHLLIWDIDTLEPLNRVTDNCGISFLCLCNDSGVVKTEYLFVKDGEVIF
jgi:hypothetical protein